MARQYNRLEGFPPGWAVPHLVLDQAAQMGQTLKMEKLISIIALIQVKKHMS
jgi:hypothetical protein